ncbi:MAG: hypothetical protein KAT46_03045 [Deltaproteobacteria bacterium]|nr:hypothetical protein [Deltaproteobacteria bacterium]
MDLSANDVVNTTAVDKALEKTESEVDKVSDSFKRFGSKVSVFSDALDALVSFKDKATDLSVSFSKTTDSYMTSLEKMELQWDKATASESPDKKSIPDGVTMEMASIGVGEQTGNALRLAVIQSSNQDILDAEGNLNDSLHNIRDEANKKQLEQDRKTRDMKLSIAGSTAGNMANMMQNLMVLTNSKNKHMFNAMKGFAIAEAAIQGYRAAVGAYAFGAKIGGPVLGAAFAASAIISTAVRIKQIAATSPGNATASIGAGGSVNPSYHGGSTTAYPAPQRLEETPVQNVTINIHNPLSDGNWDSISEDLVSAINRAGDKNVELTIRTTEA